MTFHSAHGSSEACSLGVWKPINKAGVATVHQKKRIAEAMCQKGCKGHREGIILKATCGMLGRLRWLLTYLNAFDAVHVL